MMGFSARLQGKVPLASTARVQSVPQLAKPKIASSCTEKLCLRQQALPSLRRVSSSRVKKSVVASSNAIVAATSAPLPAKKEFKWGADMKNLSICVAVGVITWFCPAPTGAFFTAISILHASLALIFNRFQQITLQGPNAHWKLTLSPVIWSQNSDQLHPLPVCVNHSLQFQGTTALVLSTLSTQLIKKASFAVLTRLLHDVSMAYRCHHPGMAPAGNFPCHHRGDYHAAPSLGCRCNAWSGNHDADQGAHFWSCLQRVLQRNSVSHLIATNPLHPATCRAISQSSTCALERRLLGQQE